MKLNFAIVVIVALVTIDAVYGGESNPTVAEIPYSQVGDGLGESAYFSSNDCTQSYVLVRFIDCGIGRQSWFASKLARYERCLDLNFTIGKESFKFLLTTGDGKNRGNVILGPFPYTGEAVSFTTKLYKIKTKDHLKQLIELTGKIASQFTADLGQLERVSGIVGENIDYVLKEEATLLVSKDERVEYTGHDAGAFKSGYFIFTRRELTDDELDAIEIDSNLNVKEIPRKVPYVILHIRNIPTMAEQIPQSRPFKRFEGIAATGKDVKKNLLLAAGLLDTDVTVSYPDKIATKALYKSRIQNAGLAIDDNELGLVGWCDLNGSVHPEDATNLVVTKIALDEMEKVAEPPSSIEEIKNTVSDLSLDEHKTLTEKLKDQISATPNSAFFQEIGAVK